MKAPEPEEIPSPGSDDRPVTPVDEDILGFSTEMHVRVEMPEASLEALAGLPDEALREQAVSTTRMRKRFTDVVLAAADNPDAIHEFIKELGPRVVSRDHDWRGVFDWLRTAEDVSLDHERVAVNGYLRYLRAREEKLESMLAERQSPNETGAIMVPVRLVRDDESGLARLPQGEPFEVDLPYRGERSLWLGRHEFMLRDGYPPAVVDPEGRARALRHKPTTVGRGTKSDILVRSQFTDVSRTHMVVEWEGGTSVHITDLSSRGTFIDPDWKPDAPSEEDGQDSGTGPQGPLTVGSRTGDVRLGLASARQPDEPAPEGSSPEESAGDEPT